MIALFISLAILLVLVILSIIFLPSFLRKYYRKNYVEIYGKKIYRYALHNDLYLINVLELKGNDDQLIKIDHLLFGNKYIYIIKDFYMPGNIEAKENDPSFIYTTLGKNPKKYYIDNFLFKNDELAKKVSSNLGLSRSLFIPISIVDNDADFGDFHPEIKDNYLIHISNFNKLIDSLESRKVAPLNDEQLKYAVKDVNRLNERRKTNKSR